MDRARDPLHRVGPATLWGSGRARSAYLTWLGAIERRTEKAPNGRASGSWPQFGARWPLPVSTETQNCGSF